MTDVLNPPGPYALCEHHEELRAVIRELAAKEILPYAADVDEQERFPVEAYEGLTNAGFHAAHIGEEYGGQGADAISVCLMVEEIARVDATAALIPIVNRLGTQAVIRSGSAELKQRLLPAVASGEVSMAYALSEREAGSDAAAMSTNARSDSDTWILNGAKCWVTHAGFATWYTVMAVTNPEAASRSDAISAFLVHKEDPGFSVGPCTRKMGLRGSPMRDIYFDNCVIPADRIVGEPGSGLKIALGTLDHTRPLAGAQALGIAQGALDAALGHVKERRQFGKAIAEFQGVQFMLADMGTKIEAARHLVYASAAASERGDERRGFMSAAAKTFASDVALSVTADAVQLFGGAGYTRDVPVERMMRDAKSTQIVEGTNQIQRMVMARALLKG
ncbi:acyl-CoA dehydrogenase family protein [Streptomyces sp. NPDC020883]|uniref:acyl-CoA dehydrogenase family protein n=1 Tax=Streptomyces sp. NPDC020883 TaxID=3365099 RepID=UPI0037ACB582